MKSINILSVAQVNMTQSESTLQSFLLASGIKMKKQEVDDLTEFIITLNEKGHLSPALYNDYFVGYEIPQISREFDLLRFGNNYILNIELKNESTEEKIIKQLKRNKYYLSFLDTPSLHFTYVTNVNKLYRLDDEKIIEIDYSKFAETLINQESRKISDIDSYFTPSNYLVSPFNSTDKFIDDNYFLTNQQEDIKNQIIKRIETIKKNFIKISAKDGTGKTLLIYDIAKLYHINQSKNVLIIHCGKLNQGHYTLRDENGWNIIAIKDFKNQDYSIYNLLIIDETQRIKKIQLSYILEQIEQNSITGIFSLDPNQCLRGFEASRNIDQFLESSISPVSYKLTDKIRTNKEISYFIRGFFNKNFSSKIDNSKNVEISFFSSVQSALNHMELLKSKDWKIINLTQSLHDVLPYDKLTANGQQNAHDVIGQEFEKVVAVIDQYFYYKDDGYLSTKGYKKRPYYHPTKMLFQIMTRTQKKLNVIIIKNPEVLSRAMELTS